MYNLLIALGCAALAFIGVTAWIGPLPAILPALIVLVAAFFLLARRVGRLVEPEMQRVVALLQERKIDEGRQELEAIKGRWSKWQFLLAGQLDAQLGTLDYLQMKWDTALPRLQAGAWRNWSALAFIGCIHWRKGDRAKAWESFEKAAAASPKESIVYVVWATLLTKADEREKALTVVDQGLKENPESTVLKELQATIANKRKIDTKLFPETWYQFFPEEYVQQQLVRGRRDQGPGGPAAPIVPGLEPKPNRKMRRSK